MSPKTSRALLPKLPTFPKFFIHLMGHYGQSQTPGQGQDTRTGERDLVSCDGSKDRVAAIVEVVGENAFWAC
ncbi:MAG: hypothetical protein II294_03245 [Muribaculaceae bacterium]|nr:hypothetical protein [Muribaculaceae bacterium]